MATRPLRQHYATDGAAPVPVDVDPALASFVEPWRAHRSRFLGAVRGLDAGGWDHATRCAEWSVRDVVAHLVTVDGFWPVAMAPARDDGPPTTYLRGFDPSSSPDEFREGRHCGHVRLGAARTARRRARGVARVRDRAGRRRLEPAVRVAARARPRAPDPRPRLLGLVAPRVRHLRPAGRSAGGRARRPARRDVVQLGHGGPPGWPRRGFACSRTRSRGADRRAASCSRTYPRTPCTSRSGPRPTASPSRVAGPVTVRSPRGAPSISWKV